MKKFFFALLVVLFGLLTFVAGVIAPDNIKVPVAKYAQWFYQKFDDTASATVDSVATTIEEKLDKNDAIDYSSLIEDTNTTPLGIQVALLNTNAEAALKIRELDSLKMSSTTVKVKVSDDLSWYLLAAGPYDSKDQAILAADQLSRQYDHATQFNLIKWPAKEK